MIPETQPWYRSIFDAAPTSAAGTPEHEQQNRRGREEAWFYYILAR